MKNGHWKTWKRTSVTHLIVDMMMADGMFRTKCGRTLEAVGFKTGEPLTVGGKPLLCERCSKDTYAEGVSYGM